MSTTLYEIVMLADGDFALQRADEHDEYEDRDEPLIRIHFSEEARVMLQSAGMDVAKAMIDAGIDMVEQLGDEELSDEDGGEPRVIH